MDVKKFHRESLSTLHRAKERLTSIRHGGSHHSSEDTEESVLGEIRALERGIASARTENLRRWTQIVKGGSPGRVEYTAYEPSALFQHSTITSSVVPQPDGNYWGEIGSRPLPQDIEDMPGGSPARLAAVAAWNDAQDREAWLAIVARYPEAAAGEMSCYGQIVLRKAS